MSFKRICEPCRQALQLEADRPYLNRIRQRLDLEQEVEIAARDDTGKATMLRQRLAGYYKTWPADCVCLCSANGHDPHACTGEGQFVVGGRPGSGAVDALAQRLGREPSPEDVISRNQISQNEVAKFIAWWAGDSEEDRRAAEVGMERMRYDDQLKFLVGLMKEYRPDLISARPYAELRAGLRKLVRFRDLVAHSIPISSDGLTRIKRESGQDVRIQIARTELAEYLDLSEQTHSQLKFLPLYFEQ